LNVFVSLCYQPTRIPYTSIVKSVVVLVEMDMDFVSLWNRIIGFKNLTGSRFLGMEGDERQRATVVVVVENKSEE
jgi:hypothetical protein